MKTLAIILMWVTAMLNHQFKRVLMVPHYDCAGEEVIVEGEYVKEWMIRNRIVNPGFESGSGSPLEPDNWTMSGETHTTLALSTGLGGAARSGTYCVKLTATDTDPDILLTSDAITLPETVFQFGLRAGVFGTQGLDHFNHSFRIGIAFYDDDDNLLSTSHGDWEDFPNVYGLVDVSVQSIPTGTSYIKIVISLSLVAGNVRIDDCFVSFYNPHFLFDWDDFAALNVEDLETFTFGQNYNYESGGQPLADASRLSEDTVQYLRMANSRAERVKIRDPIDIYRMRFILYSKAQQTQLMHWYKRTRGLPFIWVDENGIERDVQWVQAPDIMPRSNNPEIATVQIVLETTDAGEV